MRGRVPCGEGIAAEFAKDPQQGLRRGLRKDLRRDLQWDLQRDPQWTRSRTCSRIRSRTCAVVCGPSLLERLPTRRRKLSSRLAVRRIASGGNSPFPSAFLCLQARWARRSDDAPVRACPRPVGCAAGTRRAFRGLRLRRLRQARPLAADACAMPCAAAGREWTNARKAVCMVVGVRASLEGGKAYTSEELSRRFGLHGRALEDVLDHLMEKDCLRPVVFHRPRTHGGAVRLAGRFERHLVWQA